MPALLWTAIAFSTPLRQHEASPQPFPHIQLRSPSCSLGRTPAWTPAKHPAGPIIVTTTKIAFHTDYNQYFKENFKLFSPTDFIAELTQHVPPRGVQYIRRYGLYSSRGRGVWKTKPYLVPLAPEGGSQIDTGLPASPQPQPSIPTADSKSAWARLIAKIYEVDPLTCASCGSPMRILAVITDTAEVKKILRHLVNIGKPPPGLDPARLN